MNMNVSMPWINVLFLSFLVVFTACETQVKQDLGLPICVKYGLEETALCKEAMKSESMQKQLADALAVLKPTSLTAAVNITDPVEKYCHYVCEQDSKGASEPLCHCHNYKCYYSLRRPARLSDGSSRRKRLNQPAAEKPVNCDVPGIVGLFRDAGLDTQEAMCMGLLIDEETILLDGFCAGFLSTIDLTVHMSSYSTADVKSSEPVVLKDTKRLVSQFVSQFKLSKKVEFDEECVNPACTPNYLVTAEDLDLNNCKIMGYGQTSDDPNVPRPSQLEQVFVQINPESVTEEYLTFTRTDGKDASTPCLGESGATVVCPTKETEEWVIVGIFNPISFFCSTPEKELAPIHVLNLLKIQEQNDLYNNILKIRSYKSPRLLDNI